MSAAEGGEDGASAPPAAALLLGGAAPCGAAVAASAVAPPELPAAAAAGGPAGLLTARRALRSSPRPWLCWLAFSWPVPSDVSADSLLGRSISSIRAISPVRLPGAAGHIWPLRATRELFVRAHQSGVRRYGDPRVQARCLFLSLCDAPPLRLGHCRRAAEHPGGPGLLSRTAGGRSIAGGRTHQSDRPLRQACHQRGRRRREGRHLAERSQDVIGSDGRCQVPNNHSKYGTSG